MAREDQIEFTIPPGAFDAMADYITKNLKRDIDKKKQLQTLLRKAGKTYLDTVQMTSMGDDVHDIVYRNGVAYEYGNLSRNMKMYNGKSRTNVTVSIGPRARGKNPSGYYGLMVMPGKSKAQHISDPLDWKGEALRRAGNKTREEALGALEKYMKSKLKRLRKAGFKVD